MRASLHEQVKSKIARGVIYNPLPEVVLCRHLVLTSPRKPLGVQDAICILMLLQGAGSIEFCDDYTFITEPKHSRVVPRRIVLSAKMTHDVRAKVLRKDVEVSR